MCRANASCFWLFTHNVRLAFSLALAKEGSSRLAKMAMMAITTNNSISVNALSGCNDKEHLLRDRNIFSVVLRSFDRHCLLACVRQPCNGAIGKRAKLDADG